MESEMHRPIHEGMPVLAAGTPLQSAKAVVLLFHGRGGDAQDILGLAQSLPAEEVAFLAPQARGNSWYPYSFLSPLERNEPALSSALNTAAGLVRQVLEAGLPPEAIILAGFSQGACLAQETAIRNPRRYGGVVGLSGGLIGPPGTTWNTDGQFEDTPVFLGCSDVDPHIPRERVAESAAAFKRMGASVVERIYPGMGHTINEDELHAFAEIVAAVRRGVRPLQ